VRWDARYTHNERYPPIAMVLERTCRVTRSDAHFQDASTPAEVQRGPVRTLPPGRRVGSAPDGPPGRPRNLAFLPLSGPVGTSVTITGTGFTGATAVTFNGTPASFTVDLSTQITAKVPAGATDGPIATCAFEIVRHACSTDTSGGR
jgi:hypothetical protein